MPYAVVVTFDIKPGRFEEFMPLVLSNGRSSVELEEGCHQFDVVTDPERPNEVFLYEIYSDRAAFERHLASAHFKTFDTGIAEMVAGKDVRTYSQVVQ